MGVSIKLSNISNLILNISHYGNHSQLMDPCKTMSPFKIFYAPHEFAGAP